MIQKICYWILYKQLGWTKEVTVDIPEKYIICLAPHTSNWDLILGQLYAHAERIKSNFLMKKEWFFWPLGPIFRWMGGIPVDRSRKSSLVDQMINIAKSGKKFHLAITPEGTRKANPNWKKGFYYIAQGAGLPIILVAIDYEKKCITAEKVIHPSGDIEKDMREIKLYYKDFKGKHPELFTIGNIQ